MNAVRVSSEELQTLAAECASVSFELATDTPTARVGPPGQATSAAVVGGYVVLEEAAGVLAARVRDTGAKLSAASDEYAVADDQSAQRIAAAIPST